MLLCLSILLMVETILSQTEDGEVEEKITVADPRLLSLHTRMIPHVDEEEEAKAAIVEENYQHHFTITKRQNTTKMIRDQEETQEAVEAEKKFPQAEEEVVDKMWVSTSKIESSNRRKLMLKMTKSYIRKK